MQDVGSNPLENKRLWLHLPFPSRLWIFSGIIHLVSSPLQLTVRLITNPADQNYLPFFLSGRFAKFFLRNHFARLPESLFKDEHIIFAGNTSKSKIFTPPSVRRRYDIAIMSWEGLMEPWRAEGEIDWSSKTWPWIPALLFPCFTYRVKIFNLSTCWMYRWKNKSHL